MECAVIVPVLARPDNVAPLVRSFVNSHADARLYFIVDEHDTAEVDAVTEAVVDNAGRVCMVPMPLSPVDDHYGPQPTSFAQKVNYGVNVTVAPWLLVIGDDVTFSRGWMQNALNSAEKTGKRFLSTNDMANPHVRSGLHCIHPFVAREYIEAVGVTFDGTPGVLACEEYRHQFVDNEWTVKARHDGEYYFAHDAIVRHHHPVFDRSVKMDATYQRGQATTYADGETYRRRLARYLLSTSSKPIH